MSKKKPHSKNCGSTKSDSMLLVMKGTHDRNTCRNVSYASVEYLVCFASSIESVFEIAGSEFRNINPSSSRGQEEGVIHLEFERWHHSRGAEIYSVVQVGVETVWATKIT